ncbi:hypothetical protein KGO95_01075 [Patescibacteria group bacterium]|nr:hypothetical protein [Patescibacteria group bacterium]
MTQKPERSKVPEAIISAMLAALIIAVLTMPILKYLGILKLLTNLSVTCAKAIFRALGYPPV